jgi:hypothetical protein
MLRTDLTKILRGIKKAVPVSYLAMITNPSLLKNRVQLKTTLGRCRIE